ncbi:MAG: rod shape-determining protein MreC [Atopobiaceae bacterium]|nr:rod shape-determining protein MreC [Atopobiaceae bacterium]
MPSGHSRPSTSKLMRKETGGGSGLLAMVLVIVSLVLFTFNVGETNGGPLTAVSGVVQTIVAPLRLAGAGILAPFAGMSNVMRNLTADEKTLTELIEENERLQARNVELEEAEVTARQLQELLDLRSTYNLQSSAAHVIAGATDSWSATVTLDKGTSSGFVVGMPVTDSSGAVGQIIACSATTSTVRLLTDEASSVAAMIQSTRAQGMLEGTPDAAMRLSFIRTDQTVNVGDIVVTSGLGGVFPKGLPLGKVSVVDRSPGSTYYSITVEPFARIDNLEEVLVITSLTEEQQVTAEDIEQSDAADMEAASGEVEKVEESSKSNEVEEDTETTDADDEEGSSSKKDEEDEEIEGAYVSPYSARRKED